jgi:hypothetical protein
MGHGVALRNLNVYTNPRYVVSSVGGTRSLVQSELDSVNVKFWVGVFPDPFIEPLDHGDRLIATQHGYPGPCQERRDYIHLIPIQ